MKLYDKDKIKNFISWVEEKTPDDKQEIWLRLNSLKTNDGWKWVVEELNNKIQTYTDCLTGDVNKEIINEELNKPVFNKYDLMRVERKLMKYIVDLPDRLIKLNKDPVKRVIDI